MRKSISEWAFPDDMPLTNRMAIAQAAGFEGIEVALTEDNDGSQHELGLLCMDSYEEDCSRILESAQRVGIEIPSVATGLYWAYSLTADDPEERAKAIDVTQVLLRSASRLGVDGVLVIPGNVHATFIPDCPIVPYPVVWERALAAIKEAAPLAEELGVSMGLEYVWNMFLLSPLEMRRFIEEVGSERVGFYLDTGNMMSTGFPEQWIRILGDKIVRVHFKDFKRSIGTLDGFCDLLEGDVNWPEVMRALAEVGYDGWVTAEMMPPYKYAPEEFMHIISRAMDCIFEMGS